MHNASLVPFEPLVFLAHAGLGRRIIHLRPKEVLFSQGGLADAVFYILKGKAKLTVVSQAGKEATISHLNAGDFIGEEAIAIACCRHATATALTACSALKIERAEMMRVVREEPSFSELFVDFILTRGMKTQADLVDQLFNSSQKRLARILLLMADFNKPGESKRIIPKISQETLAEMIGTTRSRVSFFMNRFRKHGFLEYNDRIHVHESLLNVVSMIKCSTRTPVSRFFSQISLRLSARSTLLSSLAAQCTLSRERTSKVVPRQCSDETSQCRTAQPVARA